MIESPLSEASVSGSGGASFGNTGKPKRNLAATVMLTSLVDTFSVLVIYLLVSFSSTGELLYMSEGMELPAAAKAVELERNVVVKVEKDKLYIEEEEIKPNKLVRRLVDMKKNWAKYYPDTEFTGAMTIQADRRQTYDLLSHVVQAGGHAGFSDINFAVIRK
ncbi:MAG: biopolymer transporter ExbD [Bdellovibrionales bacterium]|nr:biopolymer transporter ExbD [Bdellovibrionales bacterium]NQZ18861.1 biopolymer transporter ExbD [Bdellovibrionales bacterium]